MSTAKEPAFPCEVYHREDGTLAGVQTGSKQGIATGLTKRELFAAMAMQGLLACHEELDVDYMARNAVTCADALLEKLEAQ